MYIKFHLILSDFKVAQTYAVELIYYNQTWCKNFKILESPCINLIIIIVFKKVLILEQLQTQL